MLTGAARLRHCATQGEPREYPGLPRLGVAATVLSKVSPRRVLLVRRSKPPGEGCWSLPGGLIDLGEGIGAAALREVEEETMVSPTVTSRPLNESAAFYVTEGVYPDEDGRVRYHYVLCHVLCFGDDTVDPVASDDAADARWVEVSLLLSGKSLAGSDYELLPKTLGVLEAALAIAGDVGDEPVPQ